MASRSNMGHWARTVRVAAAGWALSLPGAAWASPGDAPTAAAVTQSPPAKRDVFLRLASMFHREPAAPVAPPVVPTSESLPWWSIPRRARVAARKYALAQNARVSRYVRVAEPDGTARFDVHATRYEGRRKVEEFLLVSVPDPEAKPNATTSP